MPRLLFLLPLPDLEDVATSGVGCESAGTWLAGRGEADLVTVRLQFVDTEHNLFLGRDGIHVFRPFRRVELDLPRSASGVLRQSRYVQGFIFDDSGTLLNFI